MIDVYSLSEVQRTTPRRIMKYVLIWCSRGTVSLQIDGKDFKLEAGGVMTITSGQVHCILEKHDADGYLLEFTYDFFCKDDKDVELVFENGLFCHFDDNQVILLKDRSLTMEHHLKQIVFELHTKPYQYLTSIHSRVALLLVEINRAKVERGDEIWKPGALFLKFLESVRASFDSSYTVTQYADALNTTEQKLNEQAKLHAGKTAQMVIYGLLAAEAKRLLLYESLSVKEIVFRLGFKDPFYFSNFFKKQIGCSPKAFRERTI